MQCDVSLHLDDMLLSQDSNIITRENLRTSFGLRQRGGKTNNVSM